MLGTILNIILAYQFHNQVYNFEKRKGFTKETTVYKRQERSLDTDQRFIFDIQCTDTSADTCTKANKEALQVASFLEKTFELKKSIKMLVKFVSFCKTRCGNDTIARTGPTAYFALKEKQEILYPQSLVKQISFNSDNLDYSEYDATISFNTDPKRGKFRLYFETFEDKSEDGGYSFKFIL